MLVESFFAGFFEFAENCEVFMHDVVIVGCGPAGLGSAIYLARAKLSVLVIGFPLKSNLAKSHLIQNYLGLGFPNGLSGKEMIGLFQKHAGQFGTEFLEEEVTNVQQKDGFFLVKTSSLKEFAAKNLIIATGMSYKLSGIKNEENLTGKGIHYCVSCDGFFYKNKKIAVVGKGNYAADEALDLLTYSKNVTIFSNGQEFSISAELKSALEKNGIPLRLEKILEFRKKADSGKIELFFQNSSIEEFDGVFMAAGIASAFSFAQKLGLELSKNSIKVDADCRTNLPKVYAAGDCTGSPSQAAVSIGMGCIAALSIIKSERNKSVYIDYG